MNKKQLVAIFLSIVLIAVLTGAALGAVSWLAFWLLAGAVFLYVRLTKDK